MGTKVEIKQVPHLYPRKTPTPTPDPDRGMHIFFVFAIVVSLMLVFLAIHQGHSQKIEEHEKKALFENSFQHMNPDPEYEQPYYYSEN